MKLSRHGYWKRSIALSTAVASGEELMLCRLQMNSRSHVLSTDRLWLSVSVWVHATPTHNAKLRESPTINVAST